MDTDTVQLVKKMRAVRLVSTQTALGGKIELLQYQQHVAALQNELDVAVNVMKALYGHANDLVRQAEEVPEGNGFAPIIQVMVIIT